MRFEDAGTGRPVLFIHGAPSPSTDFLAVARALPGIRSLIVDLPGYRGEPPVTGADSFARVQTMLEDALLARGVHDVAVVGFSGGAMRAFSLAFSSRITVTALVSLGGFAGLEQQVRSNFGQTAAAIRAGQLQKEMLPTIFLAPEFAAAHPEVAREVEGWMSLIPPAALADEMETVAAGAPDLRPRLKELRIPMLAMAGELDHAVAPNSTTELAAANPAIEIELVPGAGHALLYEHPDRVIAAIRRTLER